MLSDYHTSTVLTTLPTHQDGIENCDKAYSGSGLKNFLFYGQEVHFLHKITQEWNVLGFKSEIFIDFQASPNINDWNRW